LIDYIALLSGAELALLNWTMKVALYTVLLKCSRQLISETSELKRFESWQQMKYQQVTHCDCGYVVVVLWGRHSGRRSPRP